MQYSPFVDKYNKPIPCGQIKYRHLKQLKNVEEGYTVEVKSCFDADVKKKIPNIIASFANSGGGWLIIGAKDTSHEICWVEKEGRTDYSQQLSQMIKGRISPLPVFDIQHIKNPKNRKEGVIIVYVPEGTSPPYVSNGTIYIRNGSSVDPIRSDRATIDQLYDKRKSYEKKIDEFCKREVSFPKGDYGMCNIYLYNPIKNRIPNFTYDDLDNLKEKGCKSPYVHFQHAQHSINSLVFRSADSYKDHSITLVWELLFDMSAKFHIPLKKVTDESRSEILGKLYQIDGKYEDISGDNILDALICQNCAVGCFLQFAQLLQEYKIDIGSYIMAVELENIDTSILYYDCNEFYDYVRDYGLPYACKELVLSKPSAINERYIGANPGELAAQFSTYSLAPAFGYSPTGASHLSIRATEKAYPDLKDERASALID